MSSKPSEDIFSKKVIPIMNKVRDDLQGKRANEMEKHSLSLAGLMVSAIGPDGGSAATQSFNESLYYTGKWNSKTVEDYVEMVKAELKKQHITVTPEIEKKMIDKMVKDQMPKSSIDYIIRKAAGNSIFSLPQEMRKSPLQNHIEERGEALYNPSGIETAVGWGLGAGADYLSTGGLGGTWKTAGKFIAGDLAINGVASKMTASASPVPIPAEVKDDKYKDVPLIVAPGQEDAYLEDKKRLAEKRDEEEAHSIETASIDPPSAEKPQVLQPTAQPEEQATIQPEQTNSNGWNGLLSTFGLNGIGDIGHNLGYILAMLPDFLVGMFTGKSKMNIKDNLLPIASIAAGMFVKNPILKMVLIGMGGMNLINKAGHEVLGNRQEALGNDGSRIGRTNYRVYQDEALNPRISNPELRGNCLIATIDKVPCTIALPERVVDAYQQGALPLNTLANAILAKNDQMRQLAAQNYEANEQQTVTRTIAQR